MKGLGLLTQAPVSQLIWIGSIFSSQGVKTSRDTGDHVALRLKRLKVKSGRIPGNQQVTL